MSDDDALVGQVLGGFDITGVVGRGAFATLYRATQISLHRPVALKVLEPMLARDPDATRRFVDEGLRAATLDHRNIVPVFAAGQEDGRFFIAMRLVDGHTLADETAQGPLSPERTLAVADAVGAALDNAHAHGVFHRDVKPTNILVEGERIFLSDFGIAATAQTAGVYTTGAIGTAAYMPPEQATAGAIDGRADLYGLGCVLYECITGQPPFGHDDLVALLYAHAHEPVPSTGNVATDAFFLRALAKQPEDRFASGAVMSAALREAIGGEIAEVPSTVLEPRPTTGTRRNPWRVVLSVAAAVVVVAAAVVIVNSLRSNSTSSSKSPTTCPASRAVPIVAHRSGPVTLVEPNCTQFAIPADWTISGVTPGTPENIEIERHGTRAALIVADAARGKTPADVARLSTPFPCAKSLQTPTVEVGGKVGVLCEFDDGTYVYFVVAGDRAYTIVVDSKNVPATERETFLHSFTFV